jgi:hypothetical protein
LRPRNIPQILIHFCSLDEGFKASSYLTETILDPELGHASAVNKTAFNKAHNIDEYFWTWIERPDQRLRLARFGAGMNGVGNMAPKDAILEGLVMLRSLIDHHLTSKYHIGRVRLGTAPRGLAGRRCWRWRGLTVVDTCYPLPTAPLRCPGSRVRRWGCSRGT